MEIVVRKDAREQLLAIIQVTIPGDAKIVRQVARTVLPKIRDVRTAVPLVHHRAMIHVKMDARVIVELPV